AAGERLRPREGGMILAESFSTDHNGPPIEGLSLTIFALGPKQFGEVVVLGSNGGMILAESLFADLDGPPKERLRLGMLALILKQKPEVVVVGCDAGMILA